MATNNPPDSGLSDGAKTALDNLLGYKVETAADGPVWAAFVQCLMSNLSNQQKDDNPTDFRALFYPQSNPTALSNLVGSYTGMSATDLANYSNAVLCQNMYYNTEASFRLNSPKINADVANYGATMINHAGMLGLVAISQYGNVPALVQTAKAAGATTNDYVQEVLSLIPSRILLYQDGNWTNGDLEIFDWVGKYVAMEGGALTTIGTFLDNLYAQGLPQFPNLTGSTINQYQNYIAKHSGPTYEDYTATISILTDSPQSCYQGGCVVLTDTWTYGYLNFATLAQQYSTLSSSCCSEDTEVLMADGTSKLIHEIVPGELIHGPNTPLQPLYVNKTPIKGRPLYEFMGEGKGPRLTETHPIVNANAGSAIDRHALSLSVSDTGLRQILPNHFQHGATALKSDDSKVHSITLSPSGIATNDAEQIKVVTPTDTSQHGNLLYDIILPFSNGERSGYYAGRHGKFVLIESEMVRLWDDPYVGVAIFECIAGLAGHEADLFGLDPDDDAQTDLRRFFDLYGHQFLQHAFKVAILNASKDDQPHYTLDQAGHAIDAFISESWKSNPVLVGKLSVVLGSLSNYLYTPLSHFIRTAWRTMPVTQITQSMTQGSAEAGEKNGMAFTVLGLNVFHPSDFFGEYLLELEIMNGMEVMARIPVQYQEAQPCHYTLDETFYFENIKKTDSPRLSFSVNNSDRSNIIAKGTLYKDLTNSYSFGQMILKNSNGKDVALLSFDIRRGITRVACQQEDVVRQNWTQEDRFRYAVSFGRAMMPAVANALKNSKELLHRQAAVFLEVS